MLIRACGFVLLAAAIHFIPIDTAKAITVGGLGVETGNCVPFGCRAVFPHTNERYQQVYEASSFAGPIEIEGIGFFYDNSTGGNFVTGNFVFELSVTSQAVDGLDTLNLDNNVTSAVHSFATLSFTGNAAESFQITGMPFLYDPALGNLLLDIKIPGGVIQGQAAAFFDAWNGNAGGTFSRAHTFASGFEGYGLETEFIPVPEPSSLLLVLAGFPALGLRGRWARAA